MAAAAAESGKSTKSSRAWLSRGDVIGLLEAAYQVELQEDAWLQHVVDVAGQLFDRGLGSVAFLYRIVAGEPVITQLKTHGAFDVAWLMRVRQQLGQQVAGVIGANPVGWRDWIHLPCGTLRDSVGASPLLDVIGVFGGARDIFAVNANDPLGYGVWVGAPMPRPGRLSPRQNELYQRLAAHLGAGYRIRRMLSGRAAHQNAEAVLSSAGGILHAEGRARGKSERSALTSALRRRDVARSLRVRKDAARATGLWRGLVDGRWSLLDAVERDGKRLVVAAPNEVLLAAPKPLSARERQVLGFAAVGRTNKEIAYELGLSAPTVRVLMARAAGKLRARSRPEAIARYLALQPK